MPAPCPRPTMRFANCCQVILLFLILQCQAMATDFVQLNATNWKEYVPAGKEVDAIYGDYVLRNDKIVVVIAKPSPLRNANLTIRNIGGFVLDLTTRQQPNDQLSCYMPLAGQFHFHSEKKLKVYLDDKKVPTGKVSGEKIKITIDSSTGPQGEKAVIEYTLEEGSPWLEVSHLVFKGESMHRIEKFSDAIRADRTFKFSTHSDKHLFCANDDWFRQCYGIGFPGGTLKKGSGRVSIDFVNQRESTSRYLIPSSSILGTKGLSDRKLGQEVHQVRFTVESPRGEVDNARIEIKAGDQALGFARTGDDGEVVFWLPNGTYSADVTSIGQKPQTRRFGVLNQREVRLRIKYGENAPHVHAKITDEAGQGIPCKVAFFGKNGTKNPDWGPDSAANPVKNLYYTHNGEFRQPIPAGEYEVIISRGPEYDAEFVTITAKPNEDTRIEATLKRVVDTKGWVSTEYHSHSTPSGDNTSDQLGRVLNLIGENIEFAPCTEHQRVDSYVPHLKMLKGEQWMSTCSGMELTGNPLPLNHQNAFPLVHKPRTQDGGGPRIDPSPVVQIERLAYWDNKSEKLVQSNHPNLIQMTGDADLDGKPDAGFKKMFDYMDVMEVHPPETIFNKPDALPVKGRRGNVIFNWMQLLNQGYRITGVVNTDAHYNYHGSGWIRNYVKSDTDEAGKIDTMQMVRNSKKGHVIMTTGPYLQVSLSPVNEGRKFIPGDDALIPSGKVKLDVRVQCANWLDVNRVQVFVNGAALKELNFTRRTHQDQFKNGVVKFEKSIPITLKGDAHIIVGTIGEGLKLGRVYGEQYGNRPPCAVSNPIFVDVDGNGFKASGDKIDSPFLITQ